ncbi:MAG: MoaD/ThiS family protein [Alphaproteobacteria bacterium]|nr:MoaD/ThiS family protein [Alphaproteobacteria bacterium]
MATVTLIGNLKMYADNITEVEVDAENIRQLFAKLGERFPGLKPHLNDTVAVAIDGEIFQETLIAKIKPDSSVQILPAIPGG